MNLKETLKLEAINRTKERVVSCNRAIVYDHSWAGEYAQAPEWDATADYGSGAFVMLNGDRCFATGVGMLPTSIKGLESFMYGILS